MFPIAQKYVDRVILAYEPVWAIGTGRTATPEIAAGAHKIIREQVKSRYGADAAAEVRIIKKYPNRRLYDTEASQYITLADVKKLVLENQYLRKELKRDFNFSQIVGKSPEMQKVFDVITQVAASRATVASITIVASSRPTSIISLRTCSGSTARAAASLTS